MTAYKVLIVGDGGVGKTSICFRATQNAFATDYKMTIGTAFFTYQREVNGQSVTLQLWDFGGQERFRSFLDRFAKGARGAVLSFDITSPESFLGLDSTWVPFLLENLPGAPVLLISTKSDLDDGSITKEMVDKYISDSKLNICGYMATSAKEGTNVHECFEKLIETFLS